MADKNDEDLSVREIKSLLTSFGVSFLDCCEKQDLVQRLREYRAQKPTESRTELWVEGTRVIADLSCVVVPHNVPAGTQPDLIVVLLHGFGASNDQFLPVIKLMLPQLGHRRTVLVSPQAPVENAWWPLDIMRLATMAMQGDKGWAQLIREEPAGLAAARVLVHTLLHTLCQLSGHPSTRIILAGYSQGAMLAVDAALHWQGALAGLMSLSGFPITVDLWGKIASRHKGLSVFQMHGEKDMLLPFKSAPWLTQVLSGGGLEVQFEPHNGGHDMGPPEMLIKIAQYICRVHDRVVV